MMTSTNEKFTQNENMDFREELVPEKASFSTGVEQDLKHIIQECQCLQPPDHTNNWNKGSMTRNNAIKKKSKSRTSRAIVVNFTKRGMNLTVKREKILQKAGNGANFLAKRNWQKLSIHPFINFMRAFRKKAPADCPMNVMKMKAREIWRKMDKVQKYPYLAQALKAKQKGYEM